MLQIRQKETGNIKETTLFNRTDHHKIARSRCAAESWENDGRNSLFRIIKEWTILGVKFVDLSGKNYKKGIHNGKEKTNSGVSKMPPTPTAPIKVPVNNPIKMIFINKGNSTH